MKESVPEKGIGMTNIQTSRLETSSHYVAQCGNKVLDSRDPSPPASTSVGIAGVIHGAGPRSGSSEKQPPSKPATEMKESVPERALGTKNIQISRPEIFSPLPLRAGGKVLDSRHPSPVASLSADIVGGIQGAGPRSGSSEKQPPLKPTTEIKESIPERALGTKNIQTSRPEIFSPLPLRAGGKVLDSRRPSPVASVSADIVGGIQGAGPRSGSCEKQTPLKPTTEMKESVPEKALGTKNIQTSRPEIFSPLPLRAGGKVLDSRRPSPVASLSADIVGGIQGAGPRSGYSEKQPPFKLTTEMKESVPERALGTKDIQTSRPDIFSPLPLRAGGKVLHSRHPSPVASLSADIVGGIQGAGPRSGYSEKQPPFKLTTEMKESVPERALGTKDIQTSRPDIFSPLLPRAGGKVLHSRHSSPVASLSADIVGGIQGAGPRSGSSEKQPPLKPISEMQESVPERALETKNIQSSRPETWSCYVPSTGAKVMDSRHPFPVASPSAGFVGGIHGAGPRSGSSEKQPSLKPTTEMKESVPEKALGTKDLQTSRPETCFRLVPQAGDKVLDSRHSSPVASLSADIVGGIQGAGPRSGVPLLNPRDFPGFPEKQLPLKPTTEIKESVPERAIGTKNVQISRPDTCSRLVPQAGDKVLESRHSSPVVLPSAGFVGSIHDAGPRSGASEKQPPLKPTTEIKESVPERALETKNMQISRSAGGKVLDSRPQSPVDSPSTGFVVGIQGAGPRSESSDKQPPLKPISEMQESVPERALETKNIQSSRPETRSLLVSQAGDKVLDSRHPSPGASLSAGFVGGIQGAGTRSGASEKQPPLKPTTEIKESVPERALGRKSIQTFRLETWSRHGLQAGEKGLEPRHPSPVAYPSAGFLDGILDAELISRASEKQLSLKPTIEIKESVPERALGTKNIQTSRPGSRSVAQTGMQWPRPCSAQHQTPEALQSSCIRLPSYRCLSDISECSAEQDIELTLEEEQQSLEGSANNQPEAEGGKQHESNEVETLESLHDGDADDSDGDGSIPQRKSQTIDNQHLAEKDNEESDSNGPALHMKEVKKNESKQQTSEESAVTPVFEKASVPTGGLLPMNDVSSLSDINDKDRRPAKKTSSGKKKEKNQIHSMDDLDDLTCSFEIASEDHELPSFNYENFTLLLEQHAMHCKDSVSLLKIQEAFLSCKGLLERKRNYCEQLTRKMKTMENIVGVLQQELSETKEVKSQLEHQKVGWEQELCGLRFTLEQEKEKRRDERN
nr:ankyrin repeat domain-containing protein 36C-like [Microcebus murinus]